LIGLAFDDNTAAGSNNDETSKTTLNSFRIEMYLLTLQGTVVLDLNWHILGH
jgi:hypothetical protein